MHDDKSIKAFVLALVYFPYSKSLFNDIGSTTTSPMFVGLTLQKQGHHHHTYNDHLIGG